MPCFYHPDREAINTCSKCGQPVCSECNYVTGTQPICRNCWDKRLSTHVSGVRSRPPKKVKARLREELSTKEATGRKGEAQVRAHQKHKKVSNKNTTRTQWELPSVIDKTADGIEFVMDRLGDGVVFTFEKLVNLRTAILKTTSPKAKK